MTQYDICLQTVLFSLVDINPAWEIKTEIQNLSYDWVKILVFFWEVEAHASC